MLLGVQSRERDDEDAGALLSGLVREQEGATSLEATTPGHSDIPEVYSRTWLHPQPNSG